MARNLGHRIEILVTVEDARGQRELARTFDTIMEGTRWSWALRSDGTCVYRGRRAKERRASTAR